MLAREHYAAILDRRYANLLLATAAIANALGACAADLLVVLHLATLLFAASRLATTVGFTTTTGFKTC